MKTLSRTFTTCAAAAALLLATVGVAQAYDPDTPVNDVAEAIAAVAPEAGDVLSPAKAGGAFATRTDETTTLIPADPSAPVTLTSTDPAAPDLAVTLPDLAGADDARQAEDGTLVYMSDDDAPLAVQPLADGSTRARPGSSPTPSPPIPGSGSSSSTESRTQDPARKPFTTSTPLGTVGGERRLLRDWPRSMRRRICSRGRSPRGTSATSSTATSIPVRQRQRSRAGTSSLGGPTSGSRAPSPQSATPERGSEP